MGRRRVQRLRAVVIVSLLVLFLIPLVLSVPDILSGPGGVQRERHVVVYLFPIGPGDSITVHTVSMLRGANFSKVLGESFTTIYVVNVSWPFTEALVDGVRRRVPTILLGLPQELLGRNLSAPIEVSLLGESLCLPLVYSGETGDGGRVYTASTPGVCKSVAVSAVYRRDGVLERFTVYTVLGETLYTEYREVVARSTSHRDPVAVSVPVDEAVFCQGYYSRDLLYTAPGAYELYPFGGVYLGSLSSPDKRPLLILLKDRGLEGLWASLPGRYSGVVVVVSPLLRDSWSLPHLDDVLRHGAVLLTPDGRVVTGREEVERELERLFGGGG